MRQNHHVEQQRLVLGSWVTRTRGSTASPRYEAQRFTVNTSAIRFALQVEALPGPTRHDCRSHRRAMPLTLALIWAARHFTISAGGLQLRLGEVLSGSRDSMGHVELPCDLKVRCLGLNGRSRRALVRGYSTSGQVYRGWPNASLCRRSSV